MRHWLVDILFLMFLIALVIWMYVRPTSIAPAVEMAEPNALISEYEVMEIQQELSIQEAVGAEILEEL